MKRLDLVGLHVEATSGTTVVIVREHDAPFRVMPIVVGDGEAASVAVALGRQPPPRPLAHDLMAALVEGLGARVDRVGVTALRDGTFLAEVAVLGPCGLRRLDARPSDGFALAVRVGAPLYVSETVLDEAGNVLPGRPDDGAIDRAVDEFRDFLDRLDPATPTTALGNLPDGPAVGAPGSGPGRRPGARRSRLIRAHPTATGSASRDSGPALSSARWGRRASLTTTGPPRADPGGHHPGRAHQSGE